MIVIQAQEAISRVCDGADAKDHIDNNIRDNVSTETWTIETELVIETLVEHFRQLDF